MNRPLIALAGLVVAGVTASGAAFIASSGGEEEVVQQAETPTPSVEPVLTGSPPVIGTSLPSPVACDPNAPPPPGTKLWRWVNVTMVLPEESGILLVPEGIPSDLKPPSGGFGVNIVQTNPSDGQTSSVLIDAETGEIIREDVKPQHQATLQQAKNTVGVCPFDPTVAPWPYDQAVPPDLERATWGEINYPSPDPATGIIVQEYAGDPGGSGILIWNGRSHLGVIVDQVTGKLTRGSEQIVSEDIQAFERYYSQVRHCAIDIQC